MKVFWILLLAAVPVAAMTVRGLTGPDAADVPASGVSATADVKAAAATAEKGRARARTEKAAAAALVDVDLLSPAGPADLEHLAPQSGLEPLRRSWPRWTAARALADEFMDLASAKPGSQAGDLQAARRRWEELQDKLQTSHLPGSSSLAALADQRARDLKRQIARLEAQSEAAAAATGAKTAFAANQFDVCRTRSEQWLSRYSGTADASLVEEIKTLRNRAEFQAEAELLRERVKGAATPADREAAAAAFLQRFSQSGSLADSDERMLANCRRYLARLRAEAAESEKLRAAQEAIGRASAALPGGFGQRVAQAAEILQKYPSDPVKAALRENVTRWLEESLPAKPLDEHPETREAETKDGRILRGFFREVTGPGGTAGFKRYDTWEEFQSPTADVGTWRSEDFASPPAATLPQQAVRRYNDQRARLLAQAGQRQAWQEFASACRKLEAQLSQYRSKPGASQQTVTFRQEAEFAEQVLAGNTLADLKKIW
jgi:hypothetical protein